MFINHSSFPGMVFLIDTELEILTWYITGTGLRNVVRIQPEPKPVSTISSTAICTNMRMVDRRQCGRPGIGREACLQLQCCWTPFSPGKRCSRIRPHAVRETVSRTSRRTDPRKVQATVQDSESG